MILYINKRIPIWCSLLNMSKALRYRGSLLSVPDNLTSDDVRFIVRSCCKSAVGRGMKRPLIVTDNIQEIIHSFSELIERKSWKK